MKPDRPRHGWKGRAEAWPPRRSARASRTSDASRRWPTASPSSPDCRMRASTNCCIFPADSSASRRCLTPTASAACCSTTSTRSEAGDIGPRQRRRRPRAGRPRPARPDRRSARPAAGRQGSDRGRSRDAGRAAGAGDHRARSGDGTGADRHPGDRHPVCARPRAARADHRRPRDRQDDDRRRHDHRAEGERHRLRLCRGRPEDLERHAGDRGDPPPGRAGAHDHSRGGRGDGDGNAVDRPLRGHHDGRVFPRPGRPRAGRHRRPDEARREPPRDFAPDPPVAGARGLSRRHLLRPCAPARTGGEACRGAWRRLAHRAADRRDGCRKPQRLHPDQPHLDHRRADRARRAALQRGAEAGDRRRHERQPRRRQDTGAGAARSRRDAAPRLCAVPGAGNVHAVRRHARQPHPRPADPRRSAFAASLRRTSTRLFRSPRRWRSCSASRTACSTACRWRDVAALRADLAAALAGEAPAAVRSLAGSGRIGAEERDALLAAVQPPRGGTGRRGAAKGSRHERALLRHHGAHRGHPQARLRRQRHARHRRRPCPAGARPARRRRRLFGHHRRRNRPRPAPRAGRTDVRLRRPESRPPSSCSWPNRASPAISANACSTPSGATSTAAQLFIVGTRGSALAAERGLVARLEGRHAFPFHIRSGPRRPACGGALRADRGRRDRVSRRRLHDDECRPSRRGSPPSPAFRPTSPPSDPLPTAIRRF